MLKREPMSPSLIKRIDPMQAMNLIAELDAYQEELYPSESNHLESVAQLRKPNVKMFAGFIDEEPAAIGAVKIMTTYGEIKRLFVPPRHRGHGLAKAIMNRLESEIQSHGLKFARLETGIHQPEAIGLYAKLGYLKCSPFGDYKEDPLSVFMEKRLDT